MEVGTESCVSLFKGVRDDGVESGAEVHKQDPCISPWFVQMLEEVVQSHEGTSHSSSDLLKICVKKMVASWSVQVFRQAGDTLSGPGAFLLLFFLKTWRTSSSLICSAGVGERGV